MPTGYKEVKKALKLLKEYPEYKALETSMQDVVTLSNRKFGQLCNRSQSTGLRLQKSFNRLGLIKSSTRTRLIDRNSHNRREFFRLELGSEHFLSKRGQVYKRLSNSIEILNVISTVPTIGQ